jgi:hypothetical protein
MVRLEEAKAANNHYASILQWRTSVFAGRIMQRAITLRGATFSLLFSSFKCDNYKTLSQSRYDFLKITQSFQTRKKKNERLLPHFRQK